MKQQCHTLHEHYKKNIYIFTAVVICLFLYNSNSIWHWPICLSVLVCLFLLMYALCSVFFVITLIFQSYSLTYYSLNSMLRQCVQYKGSENNVILHSETSLRPKHCWFVEKGNCVPQILTEVKSSDPKREHYVQFHFYNNFEAGITRTTDECVVKWITPLQSLEITVSVISVLGVWCAVFSWSTFLLLSYKVLIQYTLTFTLGTLCVATSVGSARILDRMGQLCLELLDWMSSFIIFLGVQPQGKQLPFPSCLLSPQRGQLHADILDYWMKM